jgi:hypothetical protein
MLTDFNPDEFDLTSVCPRMSLAETGFNFMQGEGINHRNAVHP